MLDDALVIRRRPRDCPQMLVIGDAGREYTQCNSMTMRLDFISFLEIFRATRSMVQLREYFIFQRKVVRRPSPSSSCSPSSRRCVCANCTFVVFSLAFGRLCCWWCGGVVIFLWRDARTAHSGVCLKCVFRREAASREKCGVRLLELGGVDVAHHTTHPVASELLHRLALRLEIDGLFLVLELSLIHI